jgi:hypothetical protein
MTNLVIDLLALILVLMATGIVLYGWGNLTWRCLGMTSPEKISTLTIWLGFCVVLSMVEFIHLFVPINWVVTLVLSVIGLIGLRYQWEGSAQSFVQTIRVTIKQYPWQAFIVTVMIVLWCLRAMGVPNNYDSGLYHFQSIRWLNEEPIVLGLGNLHWRLALNQAYFGFLALLNFAPYWNKGYAAGGLFLLLLTLLTIFQLAQKQSTQWKYSIGLVLFLSLGFVAASIVNPSPDNAVTLLEIVLFIYLLSLAQSSVKDEHRDRDFIHYARVIIFLCVAVVLTKFSSIGFAIGSVLCLVLLSVHIKLLARVVTLRVIAVLSVFICVHVVSGYLLSGAPLFPSTLFGAWDLSWAVPKHVAIAETELIFSWARRPGLEFSNQSGLTEGWFIAWLSTISPLVKLISIISIVLTFINIVRVLKNKETHGRSLEYLLYLPVMTGFSFWFMTAPDVRFLGAVLVLFFALSVYLILQNQTVTTALGLKVQRIFSVRHIQLFIFMFVSLISLRYLGMNSMSFNGWSLITPVIIDIKQTRSGQEIKVPTRGNQCWDSSLPCASIFNDALRKETYDMRTVFSVKP